MKQEQKYILARKVFRMNSATAVKYSLNVGEDRQHFAIKTKNSKYMAILAIEILMGQYLIPRGVVC